MSQQNCIHAVMGRWAISATFLDPSNDTSNDVDIHGDNQQQILEILGGRINLQLALENVQLKTKLSEIMSQVTGRLSNLQLEICHLRTQLHQLKAVKLRDGDVNDQLPSAARELESNDWKNLDKKNENC